MNPRYCVREDVAMKNVSVRQLQIQIEELGEQVAQLKHELETLRGKFESLDRFAHTHAHHVAGETGPMKLTKAMREFLQKKEEEEEQSETEDEEE
jgi:archaellum component FlaC